ncbi:ABC transporter substrate-binding protein [Chelatococcus reniformis]|uniref:ABC transporter substrate-binding protein n=1 Tax=Chelatococcus reniformis TaxID=1494448 RepID=A0A916U940_9HYPH|nr:ABC transporter substrate-binding protein [Chelatococcus reniformis]GGC65051.1 ABC transporter substrate-binding protein [Chelatococcus reniformis]
MTNLKSRRLCLAALASLLLAPGAAAAAEPITIGAIYPMSGSASFLGIPEERALRMVVEDWNKAGGLAGRPVKLIAYDTEGNSTKGVQQLRRLVESDKVDVLFGPSSSGESLAAIPIANELQTPMIAHGGTEAIVSPPLKYVFNSCPVDRVAISHVLAYAKRNGFKKLAMMSAADGYGQSGTRILRELAPTYGIDVVAAEEFNRQDPDITAQVLRVREREPDAIVVWSALPGPTVLLKNARAVGYDVPIIVGYGAASNALVANVGAAAEGVYISSFRLLVPDSLPDSDPSKPVVQKLYTDYKAKYGQAPENFAQHSYDAALILEQAVKSIKGPLTRDTLRDAIETVQVTGANGRFHFSPTSHGGLDLESKPLVMLRYEQGRWRVVE